MNDIPLRQSHFDAFVESCVESAWLLRKTLSQTDWCHHIEKLRIEKSFEFAHQDPFTRHAYLRPRGYPGDAVLLDYIYRLRDLPMTATTEGAEIMRFTVNAPAPRAVRFRRHFLARLIDETAASHEKSRVLSIAAGHLREAELSSALANRQIGEFVALDQDAESLKVIDNDYGHLPIRTVRASVRHLLAGKTGMGMFHLVYAAGLYDYLDDAVATRLIERMWAMTLPGGRVMIANFMPDIPDAGYMEAYMDWWLIYRDEVQVRALFSTLPASEIADIQVEFDPGRNICFLAATKAK